MTVPEPISSLAPRPGLPGRIKSAARLAFASPSAFLRSVQLALGCVTRRGREQFLRSLHSVPQHLEIAIEYPLWKARRVADRGRCYPLPAADRTSGLFSLLTTVYDTDPKFLSAMAETVFGQTLADFEWVLLDNGSKSPATRDLCKELARDPRVRSIRVEENLGIIGGMSRCLVAATRAYVVPIDSDDLLPPDALQVLAATIEANGRPPLLYSDEDKLRADELYEPYFKPEWDPVLFANSCYIAHLCAIRRDLGTELGIYSDQEATGSHDWDTFFRFARAGHTPVHVPEILYTWRVHGQSCAGDIHSKSYIFSSHRRVLGQDLAHLPHRERFELVQSPLFDRTPDWWARRKRVFPAPLLLVRVTREAVTALPEPAGPFARIATLQESSLRSMLGPQVEKFTTDVASSGEPPLVALMWDDVIPFDDEWPWEAMGIFERFPDTALVGGRLFGPDGLVWSAGEFLGVHHFCGSPERYRGKLDPGYFAWIWKQRSVSAVAPWLCVLDARFLLRFCAGRAPWNPTHLGAWLGAEAAACGARVVYTPFVAGSLGTLVDRDLPLVGQELEEFRARHRRRIPDARFYSREFGLRLPHLFRPVDPQERSEHLRNLLGPDYDTPARSSTGQVRPRGASAVMQSNSRPTP